jgi:ADP-ribosylglycohydrolase
MRVAPIGLWMAGRTTPADTELCFKVACDIAGLTHGHPTGQLSTGVMAVLVQLLASGETLVGPVHGCGDPAPTP